MKTTIFYITTAILITTTPGLSQTLSPGLNPTYNNPTIIIPDLVDPNLSEIRPRYPDLVNPERNSRPGGVENPWVVQKEIDGTTTIKPKYNNFWREDAND